MRLKAPGEENSVSVLNIQINHSHSRLERHYVNICTITSFKKSGLNEELKNGLYSIMYFTEKVK